MTIQRRPATRSEHIATAFSTVRILGKFSFFAFAPLPPRVFRENNMQRSSSARVRWRGAIIVAAGLGLWTGHGGMPAHVADGWYGTCSTSEVGTTTYTRLS